MKCEKWTDQQDTGVEQSELIHIYHTHDNTDTNSKQDAYHIRTQWNDVFLCKLS